MKRKPSTALALLLLKQQRSSAPLGQNSSIDRALSGFVPFGRMIHQTCETRILFKTYPMNVYNEIDEKRACIQAQPRPNGFVECLGFYTRRARFPLDELRKPGKMVVNMTPC